MRNHAFTLIELLVIISIVALTIGILIPAIGAGRRTACGTQRSTQLRGIHAGLVLFAQDNGGYYPGLDADGNLGEPYNGDRPATVEARMQMLLADNYFTGEYIISPSENKTEYDGTGTFTTDNHSYAMLALTGEGARFAEWRETSSAKAPVLSDRAIKMPQGIVSVHTIPGGSNEWSGSVAWNDNHVTFERDYVMPTQFGDASFANDSLFAVETDDDAAMTYKGVFNLIENPNDK